MVSIPFGLKALVQESSVFQELIEGSIVPLRMSWTSIEVVNFVSYAAFFQLGYNVIANLAPHVLSNLFSETCFTAFMTNSKESYNNEEYNYPLNLPELFNNSINPESNYHYLGLLSLDAVIWNLNIFLIQLVDQMQKAIPTAEWGENFQWKENVLSSTDFWFAEEIHGINLALCYAEQNRILQNTTEMKEKLQEFINACYAFIQYERLQKFDGFDWFLSTVFIICEGDVERSKTFITQLIHFPVTAFLWSNLGKVVDKHSKEECGTQFTFMQFLESIVSNEFPHVKFALKVLDDYQCHNYIRFMNTLDKRYGNKILPKFSIKGFN
ncbi:hypothetical protein WH47_01740 [Habropoda laboriosa]|uniref:BROMI C-terminal Rab TBC-like domain-containing protein n=1 Tax=Habropoda laboriosa TaxID=597456 RepID=A0A0L7RJE9_9HYME|nr:hypothetical protein WH47_01740 [Habropoda laboriosa]